MRGYPSLPVLAVAKPRVLAVTEVVFAETDARLTSLSGRADMACGTAGRPACPDRNWREIQREALQLLDGRERIPKLHELIANQADISDNDAIAWRFFVLRAYGRDRDANQALCPTSARLIRAIPNVTTAGISILDAGKHIPPHTGPYRGMLRYHLGLLVPKDAQGNGLAVLRIEDRRYRWREDEGILWDETCEHEVWNHGDSPRIVLIVDVARPGMPTLLRVFGRVFTGIVSHSTGLREFLAKSEVGANREVGAKSETRSCVDRHKERMKVLLKTD